MSSDWWAWRLRPKAAPSDVPVTAQALYAEVLKSSLSPGIRKLGFTGSGGRYMKPSETCWALLGLQKSAHSDSSEIRFTLNLLVVNRNTWSKLQTEKHHFSAKPSPGILYGSPVSTARIGSVMPDGEDIWWRLYPGSDVGAVVSAVIDSVRNHALPWFDEEMSRHGCSSA